MKNQNEHITIEKGKMVSGEITWRSPSNIAIVKYWGKYGKQLPRNPSLSFTLSNAHTNIKLAYKSKTVERDGILLDFLFEGKPQPFFKAKIEKYLLSLKDIFPFIQQLSLSMVSDNSFPHSSGIASSASSMSALALCMCDIERTLFNTLQTEELFYQKASYVARLGSGSASRSVYPQISVWGKHKNYLGSSDEYAIAYNKDVHPSFLKFHDDILLVSKEEKGVSSTAGHQLMENNHYANSRYNQAGIRMSELKQILMAGDVESFGSLAESEALTLHALMMCSDPSYMLMKEGTLTIINKIIACRRKEKLPIYFTLDAGPNVHVLYPDEIAKQAQNFITSELMTHCQENKVIKDHVGAGPQKLL